MVRDLYDSYAPIRITMEGRGVSYFGFSYLRSPFEQESVRLVLLRRVNEIPGVSFEPDVINAAKSVRLATLAAEPRSLQALKNVLTWVAATALQPRRRVVVQSPMAL